jgi:hypothetical protein
MRTPAATLASVLVLLTLGCDDFNALDINGPSRTIGSGRFITVTRPVQGFTRISISAGARAVVTQGGIESLEITAEDNIVPLLESTVSNGQLTLGLTANSGSITSGAIIYRIGVRELRAVTGSAAAQIEVNRLDTPFLVLELSSAATFTAAGTVDRFDFDLSSASRLHGGALATRIAFARLSSASSALVRVIDALVANANSGATLEYSGDPLVQLQTSSGATVRRVGP